LMIFAALLFYAIFFFRFDAIFHYAFFLPAAAFDDFTLLSPLRLSLRYC